MKRIPRKIKKQIPVGLYCYTPVRFDTKTGIYHIKPCKYYKYVNGLEGHCKLINTEITDQCKSCRFHWGKVK